MAKQEENDGQIHVENRSIVVPGEPLAEGMGFIPAENVYREDDQLLAERLGMVSIDGKVFKILPVSGGYAPQVNDKIIGRVEHILASGWKIDVKNCPYTARLGLKEASDEYISRGADFSTYFAEGDWMLCKITDITSRMLIDVSMEGSWLRKFEGGRIVEINPHKVPRLIGKKGSMIKMIKNKTDCEIVVGQNGLVWINGDHEMENITARAIEKINQEAHMSGLTERMTEFLEEAE